MFNPTLMEKSARRGPLTAAALLGVLALGYGWSASAAFPAAANSNCVDCRNAGAPRQQPLLGGGEELLKLNKYIQFPKLPKLGKANWNGVGPLPGAFDPSEYSPHFVTSYWSVDKGPINSPSAPWNQGLAKPYGTALFQYGMLSLGHAAAAQRGSFIP